MNFKLTFLFEDKKILNLVDVEKVLDYVNEIPELDGMDDTKNLMLVTKVPSKDIQKTLTSLVPLSNNLEVEAYVENQFDIDTIAGARYRFEKDLKAFNKRGV